MRRILLLFGGSSASLVKALGASERWITIHPNGPDSKGQPLLIQQQSDGSAKVIGGAGGSLNHLRLNAIKPQSSLKESLAQRAKERRERAVAQRKRDKEAGLLTAKKEAHQRVKDQTREAQQAFVADVAQAMGWSPEETSFSPPADAKDEDLAKLRDAHEGALMARAKAAVELNRTRLLSDADARAQAQFGDVPLATTDPELLSVQDIDPVAQQTGLGFATEYKKRAEAKGATEEIVAQEADTLRRKPRGEPKPKAKIEEGLELLRDPLGPDLTPKLVDAKAALELLRLDKKRRMAERQARDAHKKISDADSMPKAAVIEVDEAQVDKAVADQMAQDLRTISTRAFLNEVGQTAADPVKTLGRHVSAGAYNAINALALAAGGSALVDRSVVDVLGVAGAAEVLARRLHADLSPEELADVSAAAELFHLDHYMAATREALDRAHELKRHAEEISLGSAESGDDLATLQEANRLRAEAVDQAAKIMGRTLGETEANAALVYALKRGRSDKPMEAPLGDTSVEGAIRQLRAIGLQRGDYSLETVGGARVASITPAGLDRLSEPVNRADLEQVRRNLDIIGGAEDEDGWLPDGFSDRPDLGLNLKPGVAPSLAEPFRAGPDLEQSVRNYIGGRAADGDAPADIVSDLQSAAFFQKVGGRTAEYRELLDRLAPLQDAGGAMRPAEALRSSFDDMADAFAQSRGETRSPFQRQSFPVDQKAADAVHRALSEEPSGVAAYKPVGELTPQDQGALRDWFARHVAKESPEGEAIRRDLEGMSEPERETQDMFGDRATNPDWTEWKRKRDELGAKLNAASLTWPSYVEAMRSPQAAYAAVQDLVQSKVGANFAEAYNTLNPDAPLKLGRGVVRGALNHLDAVDPKARDARIAKERSLVDGLRERVGGRYASGSVHDKLDAAREDEAGLQAAQMGFFADEEEDREARPLGPEERHSLGHAAEQQLAKLIPAIGQNFKPGQPVKLFKPIMSGGKNWARQRAIKMLAANKRVALSFGTGSGKTAIGLGAFSHLHAAGEVKKGLFLVPSIAQGGFGADALRFLEPGKFKWHAQPGASREERLAAYKDPETHFSVVTHQAFRDDMLHLGAEKERVAPDEMAERVQAMDRGQRKAWMQGVMAHHGIGVDYLNIDEGHGILNRQGKDNSRLADVIDAVGDATPYYVNATADPVKNDVSEAFSLLQKMDPERYTDRGAFMRRYGVDTQAAKDELRREMARFQYPSKIDPDITATRSEVNVPVSRSQQEKLADLDRSFASVRMARMQGSVDVEALKRISPDSFRDTPADQHEAIARELSKSLGIMKTSATRRVLDADPAGGKVDAVAKIAADRGGKPGVVFAHSLETVEAIRGRLADQGLRVTTITGKHTADEKAAAIRAFNPDQGERSADIVVASDAGATGANLQSGEWLVNFDTPDTAAVHAQRNGRINRTGQKNDVELIDLVSDHPSERRARARLREKYALRDLMTTPMEQLDDTGVALFLKQRRLQRENGGAA